LHRHLPRTRACTLLAAVALAAVACSSSYADKAGGTRAKPPVVSLWPTTSKARRRSSPGSRRSSGALVGRCIEVTNHWRD